VLGEQGLSVIGPGDADGTPSSDRGVVGQIALEAMMCNL
jgi:hypothetical protein